MVEPQDKAPKKTGLRGPFMPRLSTTMARTIALLGCVLGSLLGTLTAGASPTIGKITLSGAAHGTDVMSNPKLQCVTQPIGGGGGVSLYLYFSITKNPATGAPFAGDPEISITQLTKGASTQSVNFASTKDYILGVTPSTTIGEWISGWGSQSGVPPYHHLGSGTLSMSSNGKSGKLTTTMIGYSGSAKTMGGLNVTATWNCD